MASYVTLLCLVTIIVFASVLEAHQATSQKHWKRNKMTGSSMVSIDFMERKFSSSFLVICAYCTTVSQILFLASGEIP